MFGTRHRGRANGLIVTIGVMGSASGLLLIGVLNDWLGSYGKAFAVVALAPLAAAVLVLARFPETARVELEDLNPDDATLD